MIAHDFKQLAEQCLARADQAKGSPQGKSYLELAAVWSRLAEQESKLEPAPKATPRKQGLSSG
jgi:hypothetical protein